MKKIGIIVQRYGLELNGGAEVHARILAEHLNIKYDIQVLTTSQKEITSENNKYYSEKEDVINGVKTLRFQIEKVNNRGAAKYLRRNLRYTKKKISFSNFFWLQLLKWSYRKKEKL